MFVGWHSHEPQSRCHRTTPDCNGHPKPQPEFASDQEFEQSSAHHMTEPTQCRSDRNVSIHQTWTSSRSSWYYEHRLRKTQKEYQCPNGNDQIETPRETQRTHQSDSKQSRYTRERKNPAEGQETLSSATELMKSHQSFLETEIQQIRGVTKTKNLLQFNGLMTLTQTFKRDATLSTERITHTFGKHTTPLWKPPRTRQKRDAGRSGQRETSENKARQRCDVQHGKPCAFCWFHFRMSIDQSSQQWFLKIPH